MVVERAIATPHWQATEAGKRILARGGSAVDAAISAAAVLTVVYPHMVSIGGDAMALMAGEDGEIVAVNGTGAYARNARREDISFRHAGQMPSYGVDAITVPGAVAAWQDMHTRSGRLAWAELFSDAIALARDGMAVAGALSRDLESLKAGLVKDRGLRSLFFDSEGAPFGEGMIVRQPALAETMTLIAELGAAVLYGGSVGARLVDGLSRQGSALTLGDLSRHQTEFVQPISQSYRGLEVVTTPPNSQGFVLLQILGALSRMGISGALGVERAHQVARLFAASNAERSYLGEPTNMAVSVDELLSEEHISLILNKVAQETRSAVEQSPRPTGDTVAIVAIDDRGEAVSLIQSVFFAFGSMILEPSTGILMQNRGSSFTLEEGKAATLQPGVRPPHTLMPVMLRREGQLNAVLGTMGGPSQAQIQAQLIQRLIDGEPPQHLVSQPRWVVGRYDGVHEDVVLAEARCSEDLRAELTKSGLPVAIGSEWDDRAGHSQVLLRNGMTVQVGTDPRADAKVR